MSTAATDRARERRGDKRIARLRELGKSVGRELIYVVRGGGVSNILAFYAGGNQAAIRRSVFTCLDIVLGAAAEEIERRRRWPSLKALGQLADGVAFCSAADEAIATIQSVAEPPAKVMTVAVASVRPRLEALGRQFGAEIVRRHREDGPITRDNVHAAIVVVLSFAGHELMKREIEAWRNVSDYMNGCRRRTHRRGSSQAP